MLKRISLAVVGLTLFSTSLPASELAGFWKLKVNYSPRRSRVSILQLEPTKEGMRGRMRPHVGPALEVDDLRVDQQQLDFAVTRAWGGRAFTARYSGQLEDGVLSGETAIKFGGRERTFDWTAERTTATPFSETLEPAPVTADLPLTDQNVEAWRDYILPSPEELAWTQIPWLPTFSEGILAAEAVDKPLLFWAMNGHPLGCT